LDAKREIDSLKASPVVSYEVECADCPIFLTNLAMFKEKHASKSEELDVLMVEMAELKSRPALLGACTSCPVLHGNQLRSRVERNLVSSPNPSLNLSL
jgi:hypothetical protein